MNLKVIVIEQRLSVTFKYSKLYKYSFIILQKVNSHIKNYGIGRNM